MNKILLFFYILIVAGLSISARAQENLVPLHVEAIEVSAEAQSFHIYGRYQNTCLAEARPQLQLDKNGQLVLQAVAKDFDGDFCILVLGAQYALAVEFRYLKAQLPGLRLDSEDIHAIYGPDGELLAEVDFSQVAEGIHFHQELIRGTFSIQNSRAFIKSEETGDSLEVLSPFSFKSELDGQFVEAVGHTVLSQNSNPVFQSKSSRQRFVATGLRFQ